MSGRDRLVMYLILRYDLLTELKWPIGALVTQGAHAATACLWKYKDCPVTEEYMTDIDNMHKITLKVADEKELLEVEKKLEDEKIDHRTWIEDDMKVCIAIKPMKRSVLKPHLKNLQLFG